MWNLTSHQWIIYAVKLKIIGLPGPLNGSFTHMHEFVTLHNNYLENTGSFSFAYLRNVDTFHYIISKVTFTNLQKSSDLIRKVFKYWGVVKLKVAESSFQKYSFSFSVLNFIIGSEYCWFPPLSDKFMYFFSQKMSTK